MSAALEEENATLRRTIAELRGVLDSLTREQGRRSQGAIDYHVEAVGHGRAARVRAPLPEDAAVDYVTRMSRTSWVVPGLLVLVADPVVTRDSGSVFEFLGARRVRLAYVPARLPALPGDLPSERKMQPKDVRSGLRLRHCFGGEIVVLRVEHGTGAPWAQVQSPSGEHWIDVERLCDEAEELVAT